MSSTAALTGLILSVLWALFFIHLYRNPQVVYRVKSRLVMRLNTMARNWLLRHDEKFRYEYISHEIVRRREAARARGASPGELDAIDIFSVGEDFQLLANQDSTLGGGARIRRTRSFRRE